MSSYGKKGCIHRILLLLCRRTSGILTPFARQSYNRGGAIKDPLPNATAFPHRSAIYNVGVLLIVNTDENDDEAEAIFQRESAAVNAWWPRVAQYLTGSYLNYPTASLGADYPTAFWGNNLSRLRQVKQKYDPDNVFSFPMSVPL